MGPAGELEVAWYVGCPQSGKTTLATWRAAWTARRRGVPFLALDAAGVRSFERFPRARSLEELGDLWRSGGTRAYMPADELEVDRVAAACLRAPGTVLLVDEANYWLGANTRSSGLLRLMRATQHARADVHLTTQYLGTDLPQTALACSTDLFVFRTTSPRALELLRRDWNVDPREASSLARGAFLRVRAGF